MYSTQLLSPTEIITGIVASLYSRHSVESLSTDRKVVHPIFFQLRESGCELLKRFRFDTHDMYPYSPVLDEALANMQATNDLHRNNPESAEFNISPSVVSYFENTLGNKFLPDQLSEIEEISDQLAEKLGK